MIRLLSLLAAIAAASASAAQPSPASVDPRVQTVPYNEGQITPLKVATNFHVTVMFRGEQVENVAIGDSEGWQATLNGQGDAIFLKPLRPGGMTNMTVITDARVYAFELSATYSPAADTPYTVRFSYSDALGPSGSESSMPGVGRYRLTGARALRPASIDDDGLRTFIVWGPNQTLPAVFAIDERGVHTLLEGRIRDGRYVIDAVHQKLLFKVDRHSAGATRLRPRP